MNWLRPYRKAIAGAISSALAAGFTALASVLPDGIATDEWSIIATATLMGAIGGAGLVYVAPANKPRDERGDIDTGYLLAIVTLIGVILLLFGVRFR